MNYQTDFPSIFHDFNATKLVEYEPIWFGSAFADKKQCGEDPDDATRKNLADFCYMIAEGECFDHLRFDRTDTKALQAERYGGNGIGDNGGGVRCGNIGKYQVKGIGKNPLVGAEGQTWHSYGGLNAEDAIYETIYATLLAKILPVGVATIHAIIATGPNAAYTVNTGERGWGALMIRDAALRPAHFVRAGAYTPSRRQEAMMMSDVGRVRILNKQLRKRFEGINDFVRFLGNFLMRCASQFAFARIARVMHGSVTPSNICFDGRWIDLANTSFLPSGTNTLGYTSFYEECNAPLAILRENIETFNKYNGTKLSLEPLANYYFSQLTAYFKHHLGYLFGLEWHNFLENIPNDDLEYLTMEMLALLSSGPLGRDGWPEALPADDPVLSVLEYTYCSLLNPVLEWNKESSFQFKDAEKFRIAFRVTFDCVCNEIKQNRVQFAVTSFIKAYKRSAFSAYYYKGRLTTVIKDSLNSTDLKRATALVSNSAELSKWVFTDTDDKSPVLFSSIHRTVQYDGPNGMFLLTEAGRKIQSLSAIELKTHLLMLGKQAFEIEAFDFGSTLLRLIDTIIRISQGTEEINGSA